MNIRRRSVIQGMGTVLASSLAPRLVHAQDNPRIRVTTYAGVFEKTLTETFVAHYKKQTNSEVDLVIGNARQWISQVQASPDNPPLDVLLVSPYLMLDAADQGIFEKPTVEKVPNLADVPQPFIDVAEGWGVTFDYGTTGISYHSGRVKNPPKSIVEFIERTTKGEWMASIPTISYPQAFSTLIWSFNDALGGTAEDISPALKAIKGMRENVIFWSGLTDFLNHLQSGDADIGLYTDGRTWSAYDSGLDWIRFVNPTEGAVLGPIVAMKPKNSPPAAWDFINSLLAPEPQGEFAERMSYGVTNSKVVYSDKLKERIPPVDRIRTSPTRRVNELIPLWTEQWNKEIGA